GAGIGRLNVSKLDHQIAMKMEEQCINYGGPFRSPLPSDLAIAKELPVALLQFFERIGPRRNGACITDSARKHRQSIFGRVQQIFVTHHYGARALAPRPIVTGPIATFTKP